MDQLGYYDVCLCIIGAETSVTIHHLNVLRYFLSFSFLFRWYFSHEKIYIYIKHDYKFAAVKDSVVDCRVFKSQSLFFLPWNGEIYSYGNIEKNASTAPRWEYACIVFASCESDNVIYIHIYSTFYLWEKIFAASEFFSAFVKHDLPFRNVM